MAGWPLADRGARGGDEEIGNPDPSRPDRSELEKSGFRKRMRRRDVPARLGRKPHRLVRCDVGGLGFRPGARADVERSQHLGIGVARGRRVFVAEERLPEAPEAEEVPVLLLLEDALSSHLQEESAARAVGVQRGHVAVVGFREELETVSSRAFDEVREKKGLVELGEIVVQQERVRLVLLMLEGVLHDHGKDRVRRRSLSEKPDEVSRLADSLDGILAASHGPQHHLAHRNSDVPSGKHVVAHVRDAVRSEHLGGDGEHPLLNQRRHPRVDAVRDDVVVRAEVRRVQEVDVLERHVREAEGGNLLPAPRDGRARRVETEERAPRKDVRHRDQIAPVAAAQLEHAAALRGERPGGHAAKRSSRDDPDGTEGTAARDTEPHRTRLALFPT